MADISALGTLQPVEPLDLENYKDNQSGPDVPKAGRYTVQAPDTFPSTAFGRAQSSGALSVQIDPKIVGPSNEGYVLRFTKVSAKQFKRGGITVSQLGDYLRATGVRGKLTDEQAQADAVEQTANKVYEVELDWRAYNKTTGLQVEGMTRFPSDGNGGYKPFIEDPNDFERDEVGAIKLDKDGKQIHKRLWARPTVVRFIAAV